MKTVLLTGAGFSAKSERLAREGNTAVARLLSDDASRSTTTTHSKWGAIALAAARPPIPAPMTIARSAIVSDTALSAFTSPVVRRYARSHKNCIAIAGGRCDRN